MLPPARRRRQVRATFPQRRLIGRRFKLPSSAISAVKIIEVATSAPAIADDATTVEAQW